MRFEADRAHGWFRDGMRLLPTLDGRSAACTAAMAGISGPARPHHVGSHRGAGRTAVTASVEEGDGGGTRPGGGRPMREAPVAIIGGGLAGIAAAIALGEAGHAATLYEARPRLGGATHSFARNGLMVDNGQHVFLRCCTAYRGLLDRIGGAGRVHVQDRFDVRVLTSAGRCERLRRGVLPGPFHLLPALARYPLLKPADRLRAMRVSLALAVLDPTDPALDRPISEAGWPPTGRATPRDARSGSCSRWRP